MFLRLCEIKETYVSASAYFDDAPPKMYSFLQKDTSSICCFRGVVKMILDFVNVSFSEYFGGILCWNQFCTKTNLCKNPHWQTSLDPIKDLTRKTREGRSRRQTETERVGTWKLRKTIGSNSYHGFPHDQKSSPIFLCSLC